MAQIPFIKMVASGNDFVVVDNRKKVISDLLSFTKKVCKPHVGVGADGVLLFENSRKGAFKMRIMNSDGSEAEACGNGYRCVGLYAHEILKFSKSMRVETLSGEVEIHVNHGTVKVKMTDPSGYREKVKLKGVGSGSRALELAFVNTGVPHAVLFSEDIEKIDVEKLGRVIRYHSEFAPRGTNVNFAEVTGRKSLSIRTYERGVEAETLACGTGSVAAAVIASLTDRVETPVSVKTKSGEILKIDFKRSGNKIRNVFLEGTANFVFEGRIK